MRKSSNRPDSYTSLFTDQIAALGVRNQSRIRRSSVAIVGVGGLGTAVSQLLAQSGIGELILIDPQKLTPDNFNRSAAMTATDIGMPKVVFLARFLGRRHHLRVRHVVASAESADAAAAVKHANIVCCCSNTPAGRIASARLAMRAGLVYVSAGVADARHRRAGNVLFWNPTNTRLACEGCFSTTHAAVASPGLVLPEVATAVGAISVKVILGACTNATSGRSNLFLLDLDRFSLDALLVLGRPDCPLHRHPAG
jgi:hypothetical protein